MTRSSATVQPPHRSWRYHRAGESVGRQGQAVPAVRILVAALGHGALSYGLSVYCDALAIRALEEAIPLQHGSGSSITPKPSEREIDVLVAAWENGLSLEERLQRSRSIAEGLAPP